MRVSPLRVRNLGRATSGRRPAITLVEVLIVVGIIAMLLGLLLMGVQAVRSQALAASCRNNLRQIGLAFQRYRTSDMLPPRPEEIRDKLSVYLQNTQENKQQTESLFRCPGAPLEIATTYGTNFCLQNFQSGDGNKIAMIDAVQSVVPFEGGTFDKFQTMVPGRHKAVANALYYDAHVVAYETADINPYDPTKGPANTAEYWRPQCGQCKPGQYGLTSTYYASTDYSGTSASRVESTIHLPYGAWEAYQVAYTIPLPGVTPQGAPPFSAKFVGKIMASSTDSYTFYLCCDNDAQLYVNGAMIGQRQAGGWDGPGGVLFLQPCGPVSLQANVWTDFEVRNINYGGPAHVYVQWSSGANPTPSDIPLQNMIPK